MRALHIRGLWGLGDNIYSRPLIRAVAAEREVWLETPWPELFEDLSVRFVRAERRLRTQMKNVRRQAAVRWSSPPAGAETIQLVYGHAHFARGDTITRAIERQLPIREQRGVVMDLPDLGPSPVRRGPRPLVLARPATVRAEWRNPARNPRPEYLYQTAAWLEARGYRIIWVADLAEGEEWLEAPLPDLVDGFLYGELAPRELLAFAREADLILGGVGWVIPAALALRRPALILLGGQLGHNAPDRTVDPRLVPPHQLTFIWPGRPCSCSNMLHSCDKTIPDLGRQLQTWASSRDRRRTTAA